MYFRSLKADNPLCLLRHILISLGESSHVLLNLALVSQELDISTIDLDLALLAELNVLLTAERGEAPVLADDDLLATRELVHGAAEGLDGMSTTGVTGADAEKDLANVDASNDTVGLAESATHTGLQSIGTGT